MTSPPFFPTTAMERDKILVDLEHILKTESDRAVRRAAERMYLDLTEPRKDAA